MRRSQRSTGAVARSRQCQADVSGCWPTACRPPDQRVRLRGIQGTGCRTASDRPDSYRASRSALDDEGSLHAKAQMPAEGADHLVRASRRCRERPLLLRLGTSKDVGDDPIRDCGQQVDDDVTLIPRILRRDQRSCREQNPVVGLISVVGDRDRHLSPGGNGHSIRGEGVVEHGHLDVSRWSPGGRGAAIVPTGND